MKKNNFKCIVNKFVENFSNAFDNQYIKYRINKEN